MATESTPNNSSVSVALAMAVLILLAVIIPFSTRSKIESKPKPLILRTESEIALLKGDRNRNSTEDWRDLILETMSSTTKSQADSIKVDPETLERLKDPNNLTTSFSKNIYTASAYIAKSGNVSADEQENLVADLLGAEAKKITQKVYTLNDLTISSSDSVSTRKTYGNALAKLLEKANSYELGSSDLAALMKFNETTDAKELEFFVTKKARTEEVFKDLLVLEVPPSASIYHLALINSVSVFIATLDAFAHAKEDPIKSLAFLNSYQENIRTLLISMASVQDYFVLENVPFTTKEAGYIFINRK